MSKTISVIIRSRDRVGTIGQAIESIRTQDTNAEILVVDSGSVDGTVELARREADKVIEIAPEHFSYGGALNIGAQKSAGEVHVALSAHCWLPRSDWLSRVSRYYDDPAVAGTNGELFRPDRRLLLEPYFQADPIADTDPYWGYSNHAGSWRASVWADFPFSETLTACEDKEWSLRVRSAGFRIVFDPLLRVSATHRRGEGPTALYKRARKEAEALFPYLGRPPRAPLDVFREWRYDLTDIMPGPLQLLNYNRLITLIGRANGERSAARRARYATTAGSFT